MNPTKSALSAFFIKKSLFGISLSAMLVAPTAFAQVFVNEQFNYVDQAAMAANWTISGNNALTLNSGAGNASIPGTGTAANIWSGSTLSLTPTDQNPVRLTADISAPGNAGTVGTVGLRQAGGINPLFEMGLYRVFDNTQTGPDTSAPLSPTGMGIGVRTINIGTDLNLQDWVKMGDYYNGSARFEATFTSTSVTTRVDLNIDGTWDLSYTENGTTPTGTFGDLRVHSPAASTAGAGGITVDNIVLEVVSVPEPSMYAMFSLGTLILAVARRRK
jgi:hypothetical protein